MVSACFGLRLILTPKASRTSALPQRLLAFLLPCFATFTPAPATTKAVAVDMLIENEIKVDIVNKKDMINICIGSNNPRVIVNFIDKNDKSNPGYEMEGAYVCKGTVCKGPIKDNKRLEEELSN